MKRESALLKAFVAYIVRWHCFRQHLNVIDIFNDGYFSWFSGASHDMTLSYHASHTEFLEWMRLWGGQFDKRNSLTTFWGDSEKMNETHMPLQFEMWRPAYVWINTSSLFICRQLNMCNRSSPYMQMACNYSLIGKQIDVMTALNEPAYSLSLTVEITTVEAFWLEYATNFFLSIHWLLNERSHRSNN